MTIALTVGAVVGAAIAAAALTLVALAGRDAPPATSARETVTRSVDARVLPPDATAVAATSTGSAPAATAPAATVARTTAGTMAAATQAPSPTASDPIEARLAAMTLNEKLGQMLMFGFFGRSLPPGLASLIRDFHVGNIILLPENAGAAPQVKTLIAQAQQLATESNRGIGLLVAADQEGGSRVTLTEGFSAWPRNASVGVTASADYAARVADGIAHELLSVGINMNLAPVLDVNDNPANPVIGWRSYGPDPRLVSDLGLAAIAAYQRAGVIPTAKHFPGHGNTDQDSHLTRPVVSRPRAELERIELRPFRDAVARDVDAIMTAHVIYTALDPDRPATLSRPILTGLLREQMGFSGVIITDDFTMEGVLQGYGAGPAAVEAVLAGADIVMVVAPESRQIEVYRALADALNQGTLTPERIDASVRRILRLKLRYGLLL